MRRLIPHPVLSVTLLVLWLLVTNSMSAGALVLGAVLAVVLPLYSLRFWPHESRIRRPGLLLALFAKVIWDIVVANFQAAKVILGPRSALRPGFITVPLQVTDPLAITMLTSFISLTPGTVSAELSPDRLSLSVHSLDIDDAENAILQIKQRYEAPLLEIFPC